MSQRNIFYKSFSKDAQSLLPIESLKNQPFELNEINSHRCTTINNEKLSNPSGDYRRKPGT